MSNVPRLNSDLLDPDDCFVIDLNTLMIVWIGSGSTEAEKRGAMSFLENYLETCEARHITKFTPVRVLHEHDPWPRKLYRAFGQKSSFKTAIGAVLGAVHIDKTIQSRLDGR